MLLFCLLLCSKPALFPSANPSGVAFSRAVYCVRFYRLEHTLQQTSTRWRYVTGDQVVHDAALVVRWCAALGGFASASRYPLCLWNALMFYTGAFCTFANVQIYSRVCSEGCGKQVLSQKLDLQQRKILPAISVSGAIQRRLISSGWLPSGSARGYSHFHHSLMTPFPSSPNKHLRVKFSWSYIETEDLYSKLTFKYLMVFTWA